MNKEDSLALYAQGRDAWNKWAEEMLTARTTLEGVTEWDDEAGRQWREEAEANFSGHVFVEQVKFDHFIFPGDARFDYVAFGDSARFSNTTVTGYARFHNSTFESHANFQNAKFVRGADFGYTIFRRSVGFHNAKFEDQSVFIDTIFSGDARFDSSEFRRFARFNNTAFRADAWFPNVTFNSHLRFDESTFMGNAWFDLSIFGGATDFENAIFRNEADFSAIRGDRAFSLANVEFNRLPDFNQAHFNEAPRLDNLRIASKHQRLLTLAFALKLATKPICRPLRLLHRVTRSDISTCKRRLIAIQAPDHNLPASWRSLKRLAIQAHDHSRELDFFKGEIKARRFCDDKIWHTTFWAGLAYQMLSDFGRSVFRPFAWFCASLAGFAWLYHADRAVQATKTATLGCGEPLLTAVQLSLHKALPLPGITSGNKLNQIYACLYGVHSEKPFRPVILDTVALMGYGQTLVSAILIFLLLLALRNHFRVK